MTAVVKSEAEWKAELSDFEYKVLREKATEPAGSGEYDGFYPKAGEGHFVCRGCKNPLYSAEAKFASGCVRVCARARSSIPHPTVPPTRRPRGMRACLLF